MIRLYRGYRIEVVRMKDHLTSRVERLQDGFVIMSGRYPSGWKVREALTDLRAALDLEMGVLEERGDPTELDMEAEMALELEEGDG